MKRSKSLVAAATLLTLLPTALLGAESNSNLFDRPHASAAPLFADTVVAKGKGLEIKQSQVEAMYLAYKGHQAALGQAIPDDLRPRIESDIIDKLIATRLFLNRATPEDRARAKELADTFIADQKKAVVTEESFKRQLLAMGMTPEEFSTQVHEQAIVKIVIDREIKAFLTVQDADALKFYSNNPALFQQPEFVRTSQIFISTRDPITKKPLTPERKLEKKRLAEKIVTRARAGEDFGALVREFSQDPVTKDKGGEYTFPRAKDDPRRAMIPEIEAAAFSMVPNQISDVVETDYGYHIVKLLEKIPVKRQDFSLVQSRIKDTLLRDEVEKALPAFVDKMKKEAGVVILASSNTK